MWSAIFGTAILVFLLALVVRYVYKALYGCKHEFKLLEQGPINKQSEDYPYKERKVGTYFIRECTKCGEIETTKCT